MNSFTSAHAAVPSQGWNCINSNPVKLLKEYQWVFPRRKTMMFGKWALGAVAAGFWLGAAQAAPFPVAKAPADAMQWAETVQFYYDGQPRRRYYAPPRRSYYVPPRQRYYAGPRRPYYAPRSTYGYGYNPPRRRAYAPPRFYTKDQVRAWNQRNGF